MHAASADWTEFAPPQPPAQLRALALAVLAHLLLLGALGWGVTWRHQADRTLTVEAELSAGAPVIMADRNQLKQVFFNLVKNAMEAMPAGGKLAIRVGADDDSVFVRLADTGAGIKTEDLAKLFSPYHTTKTGGHGLGLMIVQRIMRDHGGHIGIESKEGVGTIVTLQFPQKHRRVRMLPGT